MPQTVEFDIKQAVLLNNSFGPQEVRQMQEFIARDFSQYAVLRDAVGELQTREDQTPASRVRLGVCLYLLGRYYRAIEMLEQADGGAMAHYCLAKCHFARQEYAAALESYKAAEKAGYNAGDCALGRAEALRYAEDPAARCKCWIHSPARSSRQPSISPSGPPRCRPWAATPRKSSPCTSGQSRSTATTPAPCSVWPWKTIATGMTRRRWSCTSGPWAAFRPRRLAGQPRLALRRPRAVR